MKRFWLRRSEASPAEGPYDVPTLRAMAAQGQVTGESLFSADGIEWGPAVDLPTTTPVASTPASYLTAAAPGETGLFDPAPVADEPVEPAILLPEPIAPGRYAAAVSASAQVAPPPPIPAPAAPAHEAPAPAQAVPVPPAHLAPLPPALPPALPVAVLPLIPSAPAAFAPLNPSPFSPPSAISLAYSSAVGIGRIEKPRNLTWTVLASSMALIANVAFLIMEYLVYFSPRIHRGDRTYFVAILPGPETLAIVITLFVLMLGIGLTISIYWLVWIHKSHAELFRFTGGQYPISPGKALGFSFIPVFSLIWFIYVPWRMASELKSQLGVRRAKAGRVLAYQILAVTCLIGTGYLLAGLAALFTSLAMANVQDAVNVLWKRGTARSAAPPDAAAAALQAMTPDA